MKKVFTLAACLFFLSFAASAHDSAYYSGYYGKYIFAEGSPVAEVEVIWLDNMLNITSAMGNATIEQTSVDSFKMDYMDGLVIFSRDSATGKISGLSIFVQGMEMVAKKEEASAEKAVGLKVLMRKEDPII